MSDRLKSWKKTCAECAEKITCDKPCRNIKKRLNKMEPVRHLKVDKQGNIIQEEILTGDNLKSRPYRRQNQARFRVTANKTYDNLSFVPKNIKEQTSETEAQGVFKDLRKKFKIELNPRGILYYHIIEHLKARQEKPFIKFPRKEVPFFYDQENYYLMDIYFADYKIAIEVDGKAYHNKVYDDRRDKRLKVVGITTYRYPARAVIRDYKGIAAEIIRRVADGVSTHLSQVQK